ncbi:hypothetical protein ABT143_19110 [Streptomyces sp. NPDC002033]|uniref:hypothetical protein n=1 Tax=unclassified Streptomyces TaxID=2593676 RepID=UPI003330FB6A
MDASGDGRAARAPRHGMRAAGLLGTAVALLVAAVPASARTPADPPSRPVVLVDCFSKAQTRPEEYLLACGDGNNRLVGLRWESWGPRQATATGTDMVNDCRPNCAAGRFRPYPVTVTLSAPQTWPATPDLRRFTTIRLLYTHTAPAPVGKDVTYPLVY